ncbi:MAG: leucine-rich repeat domain-containing protein, partial [Ruminococcaceae bacterium]|nr:leucine-rich repeat domain-containing protein [Oscillospiraceae bacterium]
CGDGLTWKLYSDGVLYIDGEGAMPDYDYGKYSAAAAPWAFYRSDITKVVIGAGVETIGSYAFYQCTELTDVEFAADAVLTIIGAGAFGYTESLDVITLPASLETIEARCFYFSGLETVEVEDGSVLATIGDYAFRNNTGLVSVYLPDSVSTIGSAIFYACDSVVVSVAEGTYAHNYMVSKGYNYEIR